MTQSSHPHRVYQEIDLDVNNLGGGQPLAQSDPGVYQWEYPQVILKSVSGGVQFEQTTARLGTIRAWIPKRGTYLVGNFFIGDGTNSIRDGSKIFKDLDKPIPPLPSILDSYIVEYGITDQAYAEIKTGEDEHLEDFERIFDLTLKRVAEAIKSLADVYRDVGEAIQVLVAALHGTPQLIPQNPNDLPSWETHLKKVADDLTSQSSQRDKDKDHSTTGYIANISGNTVTLIPTFNNPHRSSADIIKLEKL